MKAKLLRALGFAAYAGLCFLTFAVAAYLSFSLFVRSGVTRTPDLTGLVRTEAAQLLTEQGLEWRLADDEGRYSEEIAAGHIVQQRPGPGSLVKAGSAVELVLSLGPQRVVVPDVAGQALPAVQVALAADGLAVGRTLTLLSKQASPGTVVEQYPPPGATVAPGTEVTVMLAGEDAGEAFLMPELVYRDYEQVRRFFNRRGFRLGSVRYEPYEGIAEGVILRQFPLAGHPLSRQEAISLVVATAPTEAPRPGNRS